MPTQSLIPIQTPEGELALPGFRLKRLELLNWGTFHGKVEQLIVDCRWTLISGGNGAGKSTVADALRTLLVPPAKLTYNDASIDQKLKHTRRDRTKKSYIRGTYGAISDGDSTTPIMQCHRQEGDQSILLAVFANEYTGNTVTLAQVLWLHNEEHCQFYLIARQDRNISEHLTKLGTGGQVRRNLQARGFEYWSTWPGYETKFRSYLGIPGDGALEVFNQVIGVKEVTDLNVFIRRHLLEASDTPKYIADHLKPHFTQLSACWEAIQRAGAQLEKLKPIADRYQVLKDAEQHRADYEEIRKILPTFYAQAELELRISQDEELEVEHGKFKAELDHLEALQIKDGEEKQSLLTAINNDAIGQRIQMLEAEMTSTGKTIDDKLRTFNSLKPHFALLRQSLTLNTEEQFKALRAKLLTDKGALQGNLTSQEQKKLDAALGKRQAEDERQRVAAEAQSIRDNRVLIPKGLVEVRQRICEDTGLLLSDLPFVGELLEVDEEHREWTGAIERLLHVFGISMLVPEANYQTVAKYINAAHLGIRLEFHRVPKAPPAVRTDILVDNRRVPARLNFKDGPMTTWVKAEIARRFDHFCCLDIAHLEQVDFGITKEGLIRGGTRHIKDDSARINDRRNYVLGWNTEAKLAALVKAVEEIDERIREAKGKVNQAEEQIQSIRAKLAAIGEILRIEEFHQVDAVPDQERLRRLHDEHEALSTGNNKVRELKERLKETNDRITTRQPELNKARKNLTRVEFKREENQTRCKKLRDLLKDAPDTAPYKDAIGELQDDKKLTMENVVEVKDAVQNRIQGRINQLSGTINSATTFLAAEMQAFLMTYPEEQSDLKADMDYAPEFVALKDSIEKEKLPEHKERFFRLLNRDLITDLAAFQSKLELDEKAIRSRIDSVNESLRRIEFTPGSYVQILTAPSKAPEVKDFRNDLRKCLSSGILPDSTQQEAIYQHIRELISKFDKEQEWTNRVTDVRNWLEYGVSRLSIEDHDEVEFYAASSGKSGGQKSLLAFMILASAITTQYGLASGDGKNRFRLVVVDEVFGKTDEAYSKRALEIFKNLDLQLIIVNPFDAKSRIVEDFVHSFHLVSARDDISSMKRATRVEYEAAQN